MRALLFPWFCLCLLLGLTTGSSVASDLNMKATLVWGCDEEKPADPKLKPVSPDLAKRLKGIFKWKHYFEVKSEKTAIKEKATNKFVLSDKCTVEVRNDAKTFNAKLFGEGKLLKTIDQQAKAGEDMVLAGDDKNMTAWFVVLTPQ